MKVVAVPVVGRPAMKATNGWKPWIDASILAPYAASPSKYLASGTTADASVAGCNATSITCGLKKASVSKFAVCAVPSGKPTIGGMSIAG